jgi:hypothetical protein
MRLLPHRLAWLGLTLAGAAAWAADRPNILLFTCEDTGSLLGCYGDTFARAGSR